MQVIEGSRKEKRANVYAISVQSVYRIKERMAQVQKPENDKPARKTPQDQKTVENASNDRNRAIMSRMTEDKFFRLCTYEKNEHFYNELDKDLYRETYMRLKDYFNLEDEKILQRHLIDHGIVV